MQSMRRVVWEAVVLVLVGCAAGLAGNAVRAKGLELNADHFNTTAQLSQSSDSKGLKPVETGDGLESANTGVSVMVLEQVTHCFDNCDYMPDSSDTRFLFIDARNDEDYNDGHIPGAIQIDHYRKDDYLPDILPIIENVEQVIIYCNGGECEDGLLVYVDLIEAGVFADKLCLFKDGWEAWVEACMPVEAGEE